MITPVPALAVLLLALTSQVTGSSDCVSEADVLFIVDTSHSFPSDALGDLSAQLGQGLDLGGLDTKYAFLQYGTFVTDVQELDYDPSKGAELLFMSSGRTNTHLALADARHFLSTEMGGRPDALKLIVVCSDGAHTEHDLAVEQALSLQAEDYVMVAIGVGPDIIEKGINEIANHGFNFNGEDTQTMEDRFALFSSQIQTYIEENIDCPEPPQEVLCNAADVLFILDSSASVTKAIFGEVMSSIGDLVEMDFGDVDMGFAFIQYTDWVQKIANFTETELYGAAFIANHWLYFEGHMSELNLALAEANRIFSDPAEYDARDGASRFAVIYTDGYIDDEASVLAAADDLRSLGVRIIGVGVGPEVNMDGIDAVFDASFDATDYEELGTFSELFAEDVASLCEEM